MKKLAVLLLLFLSFAPTARADALGWILSSSANSRARQAEENTKNLEARLNTLEDKLDKLTEKINYLSKKFEEELNP